MKKIYLIDGNNFIYRMFFALPEFTTKDGKIVNALFGMAKFFTNTLPKQKPDYVIFIKDAKGENFRHHLYADYKATRDRMPDNLKTQISLIEEMIEKMKIKLVEIPGCEADDVIGTLATNLGKNGEYEIDILTGDKDLYSLVSQNIKIYDTMKKKKFGPKEANEKFGVPSNMIIDYLAIVGDKSDNIPGIDGFGPQKAVELINNIGGIDEIFEEVENVNSGKKSPEDFPKTVQSCFKGKTFEKLASSKELAFLSKQLATIKKDVLLEDFKLEDYEFHPENIFNEEVISFFEKYEFNSLIGEGGATKLQTWTDLGLKVHIIDDDEKLAKLQETCLKEKQIVLDTETTSIDIIKAQLVGISIYLDDKRIYYINRLHTGKQVSDSSLKEFLKNIFDSDLLIVGHNLKYDLEILDLYLKSNLTQSSPIEERGGSKGENQRGDSKEEKQLSFNF